MTELPEELQERIDIIRHKLKFIEQKPTVACIEWLDPFMLWQDGQLAELIAIAGGNMLSTMIDPDENTLNQQDPDIIIIMLRGYTVEQSMKQISAILQLPGIDTLKAVKTNRVYIADAAQYFDGSDTVMVDSVELLAEIINPKQFIFGHEGEGWIKFQL